MISINEHSMECTKCRKILDITCFSYKNPNTKIYYLHCDKCREKTAKQINKKELEKQQYENVKLTCMVECVCGVKYVSFRIFHTVRHQNSKTHNSFVQKQKSLRV